MGRGRSKAKESRGKPNDAIASYESTIVIGGITYKASEKNSWVFGGAKKQRILDVGRQCA